MRKRQRLGQHFLTSESIAKSIVKAAKLTKNDTVLEIGTGKGILLPLLCDKAKKVTSFEADKHLYEKAKSQFAEFSNLVLKFGDGFKDKDEFTVFVSNLPYSKSRHAIEWLIQKKFSRAVIMVQKEFAEKLVSSKKKRKAISILADYSIKIEKVINVKKTYFSPPPKVDSVVLKITRKKTISSRIN